MKTKFQVSGSKIQGTSSTSTFSTMRDMYRPIATLQREHEAAMAALAGAVRADNSGEMQRLFGLIQHLEQEQRAAASLARQYALSKVRGGERSLAGMEPS